MTIETTIIHEHLEQAVHEESRYVILQGGTRSGKTYNALLWIVFKCFTEWQNKLISVVRATLPALKGSAERDFREILEFYDLYNSNMHSKTERLYYLNTNIVEFMSTDQEQKIRGRRRDVLFCNEANELSKIIFNQLVLRTKDFVLLDFNPSMLGEHWIYNLLENPPKKIKIYFCKTTYQDNIKFLQKEIVNEIEALKENDDVLWKIYGLGERGYSTAQIYKNIKSYEHEPEGGEKILGIDFGFNAPTAIVQVTIHDNNFYVRELFYESQKTNSDLISYLQSLNLKRTFIYADSAEPNRIEELVRAGFYVTPAIKDVKAGIDFCKSQNLFFQKESVNLWKEGKAYKWKEYNEQVLDEPVKFLDHLMDAMRYALYTHYLNAPQKISINGKNKLQRKLL